MRSGLLFAFFGAIASALWTTFHHEAATRINPIVGVGIISVVALMVAVILGAFKYQPGMFVMNKTGLFFIVLVGFAAFGSDYFALRMFASDIPLTIGGPILVGGSVAIVAVIGIALGEAITWQTIFGIVLVSTGAALLGRIG